MSHFDKPMYVLGYIQRDSRIYLADKDVNVTSFALSLPVLEYQTLVLREDMDTAAELLPTIPADQLNKVARSWRAKATRSLRWRSRRTPSISLIFHWPWASWRLPWTWRARPTWTTSGNCR